MLLLQAIFKSALLLCEIIGLLFMIASTILVTVSIAHGDISIQIKKNNEEEKTEESHKG